MEEVKSRGLSSLQLSLLAAFCMTLDHAAVALLPWNTAVWIAMRMAGRLTFVIFSFLMAQSAGKTSSPGRFCLRLVVFAVVTEPVFDLAFYRTLFYPWHQNVFFTLAAGLLSAGAVRRLDGPAQALAVCGTALAAQLFNTDYGGMGVLLIAAFAMAKGRHTAAIAAVFALACAASSGGQWFYLAAAAAALPIRLYNGERGGASHPFIRRWFFYFYYPAHIAVLAMLSGRL